MKSFLILMAALVSTLAIPQHAHGGGNGDPPPPGTGLTLDLGGPTTRLCGFLMIEKMGVYAFPDFKINGDMKLWIGRQRIQVLEELNVGQWNIVIEVPKSLTPFAFRWKAPGGPLIVVPTAQLYPKMASTMPGCQTP